MGKVSDMTEQQYPWIFQPPHEIDHRWMNDWPLPGTLVPTEIEDDAATRQTAEIVPVPGGVRGAPPPLPPGPTVPSDKWRRQPTPPADVLAFYWSFRNQHHHPFTRSTPWGIFVIAEGRMLLESFFASQRSSLSAPVRSQVAWDMLVSHELFHFQIDVATLRLETAIHRVEKVWKPLYLQNRQRSHPRRSANRLGYDPLEEALANAFTLWRAPRAHRALMRTFMRRQPPGYRDFARVSRTGAKAHLFDHHVDQIMSEMLEVRGIGRHLSLIDGLGRLRRDVDDAFADEPVPVYEIRRRLSFPWP